MSDYIFLASRNGFDSMGISAQLEKKGSEIALIPLPPTGFASFFCANPDVVQTNRQPRRAGGL